MSDPGSLASVGTDTGVTLEHQLAVGAALVTAGIALLPLAGYLGRRVVPERRVFFARWGGRHLLLVVVAWLLNQALLGLFISGPVETIPFIEKLNLAAAGYILPTILVFHSARQTEPNATESLGLQREKSGAAVLYGLGIYLLFLPALMGVNMLWPWVYETLAGSWEPQAVLLGFGELEGSALVYGLVLGTLVVTFFEELIFRGFLQPFLVQNFRDVGGVVLTSLIFALLHGGVAFGPIFALSLLLGGVALRTRRLWASWAMHAAHNGLMLALFLYDPELAGQPAKDAAGLLGLLP